MPAEIFCQNLLQLFGKLRLCFSQVNGVLNALYSNTDMVTAAFNSKSLGLSESMMELLPQVISKPQALGFIMAIMFNVPCTMTVAATYRENHSKKWIALSVLYYVVFSLTLACLFYHIGLLIW